MSCLPLQFSLRPLPLSFDPGCGLSLPIRLGHHWAVFFVRLDAVALAAKNGAILQRRFAAKAIRLDVVIFTQADDPQSAHFAMWLVIDETSLIRGPLHF